MRFRAFGIIIAILFLILFVGLVYIQLFKGGLYYQLSEKNHIRLIELDAMRGRIFDRNGVVLADNKFSFDVAVIYQEFRKKDIKRLSEILGQDEEDINKKIKSGYISPFSPISIAKNVDKKTAMLLEQDKFELPGVIVQIKPERYYPLGSYGSHILGYVGLIDRSKITKLKNYGYRIQDIVGYTGVEEYYDEFLRGENGGIQVEVDNRGRQLRTLGVRPTIKGKDLVLTVDSRIQKFAAELLNDERGAIIVMQPYTGEILALVSSPKFNPNVFTFNYSARKIRNLLNDYRSPMLNRAISAAFPLGSVFKIVTALAALELKKITVNTSFTCSGQLKIGRRSFKCWDVHGLQNLVQAITHSCDVYFYSIGLMAGPEALTKYAKEFGLGSKTQVDLPYEESGNVPDKIQRKLSKNEGWYKGDTANFAIGQGALLVTPIQATRLIATVANGGRLIKPYVASYIIDKKIHRSKIFASLPFRKDDLDLVKLSLRKVVSSETGTASLLNFGNLKIAGKTGTAQAGRGQSHAWFVGFCPYDKPKVAFCVFLEHGSSSHNAVILTKKLLEFLQQEGILEQDVSKSK